MLALRDQTEVLKQGIRHLHLQSSVSDPAGHLCAHPVKVDLFRGLYTLGAISYESIYLIFKQKKPVHDHLVFCAVGWSVCFM